MDSLRHRQVRVGLRARLLCLAALALLFGIRSPGMDAADGPPPGRFRIARFDFVGNRVFSATDLGLVVAGFTNRPLEFVDLEEARLALTRHYVDRGYVNSGAVLENLPGSDGVATIRIVEGRLTTITVEGNRWLGDRFYRNRLLAEGGDPLNVPQVRETLEVWRRSYPVDQVNADIQPGAVPGEALMTLEVRERFPFHLGFDVSNHHPPSTGPEQVDALLRAESLTGHGDRLEFDYGIARGAGAGMADADWLGVNDLSASYAFPISAHDAAVSGHYVRSSSSVLEAPYAELDIRSEIESFGVGLSQPVIRSARRELTLSLLGERRENQTSLLGIPYSFSPGAIAGRSVVSVLRLSAQFLERGLKQVLSARATLSLGVDAFDATRNASGPDGRFGALLGQFQYLRRLGASRCEGVLKLAGQYTDNPLLSLDQLAIGGARSVRGYRENTMVRDTGLLGSAEVRIPVWTARDKEPRLLLVPFADFGAGWNNLDLPTPFESLASAGIGLVFTPHRNLTGSLFWGHAFRTVHYSTHDLQDDGLHFQLVAWAF